MTFFQRTLQFFFLFLGIIMVLMFVSRSAFPNARFILWQLLCPSNSQIELAPGSAEIEPGEVVSAYEVVCVGEDGVRYLLSDMQLILVETGFVLGLAVIASFFAAWIRMQKRATYPMTEGINR